MISVVPSLVSGLYAFDEVVILMGWNRTYPEAIKYLIILPLTDAGIIYKTECWGKNEKLNEENWQWIFDMSTYLCASERMIDIWPDSI